jgi:exosortase A
MTAHQPIAGVEARPASTWQPHLLALGLVAAALLLLLARDAAGMATIWWTSDTYNHCILIPPIIAWLVWQRLPELRQLQPGLWWLGLLLVGAGAFAWLLGEAGGVALARHAGLILLLQGAAVTLLGKSVSRALAFPIAYALFLIPVGDQLVPFLQGLTAEICMLLLGWVGIPAHIEGIFITTPSGYFEVAEACAGIEFLVAMVAFGALVANLCFNSWTRRASFMAAAVLIPILANGVRAWGTIYISELTDIRFAASFDHVVYGWFFFAVVIALLLAAGWRFFDRRPGDPSFDPAALQPVRPAPTPPPRLVQAAAAAVALAALPLLWSAAIASAGTLPPPRDIALPDVPGWTRVPAASGRPWQPHYAGADRIRMATYRNAAGREVDLAIAVFAAQREGRELVGFGQGAAGPDSGWAAIGQGPPPPSGRLDRIASHGVVREAAIFLRVGDILTGSDLAAKLETTRVHLLGGPQRAVAVLVSAQAPAEGVSPRPAINSFLAALGDVAPLADRAAGLPGAR